MPFECDHVLSSLRLILYFLKFHRLRCTCRIPRWWCCLFWYLFIWVIWVHLLVIFPSSCCLSKITHALWFISLGFLFFVSEFGELSYGFWCIDCNDCWFCCRLQLINSFPVWSRCFWVNGWDGGVRRDSFWCFPLHSENGTILGYFR